MSVFPDTPRPMQLCAAIVTDMPVYEATGIETKRAVSRETFTHCLLDMVGEIYMGCYSIGSEFRISYMKMLDLQCNLVLKDELTIERLRKYYDERMDPFVLSAWIDKLLDDHEGQREIKFKWMLN
jgi:hypothetical protein